MARRPTSDTVAAEALGLLETVDATLATAESLTGGRLAAAVTGVPGASAHYLGGFVVYATDLKESLLRVPLTLVRESAALRCSIALMNSGAEAPDRKVRMRRIDVVPRRLQVHEGP